MCVNHQLVHSNANDQKLLMHQLIVQNTSELLQTGCSDEHLHCIGAAEVQVRFERTIELTDCKIEFIKRGRPIINEVDLLLFNHVVIKLHRVSEEWPEVGSVD